MKKSSSAGSIMRSAAATAIVLLALAACSRSATPAASTDGAASAAGAPDSVALTPLNIGTLKIAALTNLYAADKLGYFKEQGLKVTFTEMGGGAELLPAASAGKLDITLSIPSTAIMARQKGFDFKMVLQNELAASSGKDSQGTFVRADSGIVSNAGLRGKRIAVNNIYGQPWLSIVEMLNRSGIKPNEVSFVELPYSNMEDALANKQVDAALSVEPFTSKMLADPAFKVISYPAAEALPGAPIGAFWATEKWYGANQQTAEKFVAAMKEANVYLAAHPDEVKKMTADFTGMKPSIIANMKPIIWGSKVDMASIQSMLDLMLKYGLLKTPMTTASVLFPTATQ
jgi:NitT/TauT family transport system substrate-binding protein